MKAYHIMMFLFIFNLFMYAVDTGLGIYDLGYSNSFFAISTTDPDVFLEQVATKTIAVVAAALASAAIIGGLLHVQKSSQAVVYGAFTAVFWLSFISTLTVFNTIVSKYVNIIWIFGIFTAIVGFIFLAGLYQMVTGGWKSYE